MQRLFPIIILFFSGFLNAQTQEPTNEPPSLFSTCQVTLTGAPGVAYEATVTKGEIQDVNGNKWALPPLVTIPKGGKITVTAVSMTPGPITVLPGQIRTIVTPTAGWISVTNNSPATPGHSIEAQCEQALRRTTDKLFAFAEVHGILAFRRLIPVYSDGKIDVYVSQGTLDEAVSFKNNYNFDAQLYFVYRDEPTRQQAIASIRKNNRSVRGDKLKELKYVVMDVQYFKSSFNGLTADGKPVPGPVMAVAGSGYVMPTGCDLYDYVLSDESGYPGPENETIWPSHNLIGSETYAFRNEADSERWSLLLGDLTPLKTKLGFQVIKINSVQTPLLYQVVLNVSQKIAEGITRNRANHR